MIRALSCLAIVPAPKTIAVRSPVRSSTSQSRFTAVASSRMYHKVVDFVPPEWARCLTNIPEKRLQLAMLPTPIHPWHLPGQPDEFTLAIKRDDMSGSTLSGNKVRKLEFLLADAVQSGCKAVITCGGIQSNHCRATAVAARELGLDSYLVQRTPPEDMQHPDKLTCFGNQLINRLCGTGIILVPPGTYKLSLEPRMREIIKKIQEERSISTYLVPLGGSNALGLWGYVCAFQELMEQGIASQYDDIVFACGSGGTASGLAIGNYLCGSPVRIHGISVSDNSSYFHGHLNEMLDECGLAARGVRSEEILDVVDGYKGRGYGLSTNEELEFMLSVMRQTGIMLDPVYTGKAVVGLATEMKTNPSRFKGRRVLFLHTGGLLGLYDMRVEGLLRQSSSSDQQSPGQVVSWEDSSEPPPLPRIPS